MCCSEIDWNHLNMTNNIYRPTPKQCLLILTPTHPHKKYHPTKIESFLTLYSKVPLTAIPPALWNYAWDTWSNIIIVISICFQLVFNLSISNLFVWWLGIAETALGFKILNNLLLFTMNLVKGNLFPISRRNRLIPLGH